MQKQRPSSLAAKWTVAGLVVAAVGILIQYFVKVEGLPKFPTGPIVLLVAAAVITFGPRRWTAAVGLIVSLFILLGFTIATIVNWEIGAPLSNPSEFGGFVGSMIQLLGLIAALTAAIVATRQNYRSETRP